MIILLLLINLAYGADFNFGVKQTFNGPEMNLPFIKKLDLTLNLSTNFPEDFSSGQLSLDQLSSDVRIYLSPIGTSSASVLSRPNLEFTGEDICSLNITNINFNFKNFQSRLPDVWDRGILNSLKSIDKLDPRLKKPILIDKINEILAQSVSDYCFGPIL